MKMNEKRTLNYSLIKNIFLYANEEGLEIKDFLEKFMNSKLCKKIFTDGGVHFFNEASVIADFTSEVSVRKTKSKLDQTIVAYYAFIYSKFYLKTGILPNKIMQYMSYEYILKYFDHFHTINEDEVIEKVLDNYNKNHNSIRKQRSKNNINILNVSKIKELPFHSIRLFSKLFPNNYLDELEYHFETFGFFESKRSFVCANVAKSRSGIKKIIRSTLLNMYAFRKKYSISFIYFPFKLSTEDIEFVLSIISAKTNFSKFIIVEDRCVHIFNSFAEYDKYYYVYSKSDFKKAHEKYLARFDVDEE